MTGWLYISAGLILLALMVWQEWKRPNKARLAWRLAASAVAVVSLCWLAFPATIGEQRTQQQAVQQQPQADGIISCNWPLQVKAGEALEVNGVYRNNSDKKRKIVLSGFDTPMDSTTLESTGTFRLRTRPGHKGRALYRITVSEAQQVLEQEPLPVEVLPAETLQVLLLSSSPDFEDRFLADWLAQQGYPVATRSLISRDQYTTRFLNMPEQPLDMPAFDVIIADAEAMSPAERLRVNRQVTESGTGLLLKQDSAGPHPQPLKLQVQGVDGYSDPLPVDPSAHLTATGLLPVVKDSAGHMYTAVKLQGMGRVAYTTLHNTYSWQLNGRHTAYEQYWHAVLQQLARKNRQLENWYFTPVITRVNEPLAISLQTPFTGIPQLTQQQTLLSPSASTLTEGRWQASYWPEEKGWVQFKTGNSSRWTYIFGHEDWKHTYHAEQALVTANTENRSMIKWWLAVPLLASLIFLWVERKL